MTENRKACHEIIYECYHNDHIEVGSQWNSYTFRTPVFLEAGLDLHARKHTIWHILPEACRTGNLK